MNNKTIAVALSGGVDSAASAYLLQKQGYKVFGITMKLFENHNCEDAKLVAKNLGIEHFVVDFSKYFENEVINEFIDLYLNGFTPNPCIICNIKIKYGLLLDEALRLGADYLALGHYAKIAKDDNEIYHIYQSDIARKDQSYYLYHLTQDKLKHIILPLNSFQNKDEVRQKIAHILPEVSNKRDSTDLCFTQGNSLYSYIKQKRNLINCEGNFVDKNGKYIGKHKGIFNYTIGQKRGLELSNENKYFVMEISSITNEIILTENEQDLYMKAIYVDNINYIDSSNYLRDEITATVKVCQWGYFIPCKIINQKNKSALIQFLQPQRAPAKGQNAVFYCDKELLGGGIIAKTNN